MSKDVSNKVEQENLQSPEDVENIKALLNDSFEPEADSSAELPADTENPQDPEQESASQVADAIAAAIASTFDQEMGLPGELYAETWEPEPEPEELAQEELQEVPKEEPESAQEAVEQVQEQDEIPQPEQQEPVAKVPEKEQPVQSPRLKAAKKGEENPGTSYKRIKRSRPKVDLKANFHATFSGVYERRDEALPPVGTNLRAREKSLSAKTGIDRMLNPVRVVIFILSFMCLAGRKYSWMTLGFMKGIGGIYVSILFTLILLILNWQSVYRAVRDTVYLQASYESFLLITTVLSGIEAVMTRNPDSLMPLLTMSWALCGMANLMDHQADLRFLRSTITGRNKVGIRTVKKRYQGQNLIGKAPASTTGFVRRQSAMDVWHSWNSWFFLPLFVVCVIVSAYLSAKTAQNYLTILVYLLSIGMPVSMVLCCSRPYALLSQALAGKGVVAGWKGMEELSGKKSVLIYDSDLFPKGTTGHKGVKVYGRFTAAQLISYGASMVIRADIGLTEVFTRLLRDGDGELLEVRNLQVQECGLEGRIHGGRVLLGTYQFMQLMGVDVPRKGSTNGVYIAVNGSLAGMFAVKYALRSGSTAAFRRFTQDKNVTPLIVTRNFTINPAFIEKAYRVSMHRMLCPKMLLRRRLSQPDVLKGGVTCGFVLRDGLNAYSRTVAGARRVRRMGMLYTALSMLLTLYLVFNAVSAISGGTGLIEITRVLLMQFWLLVGVEIGARVAVRN